MNVLRLLLVLVLATLLPLRGAMAAAAVCPLAAGQAVAAAHEGHGEHPMPHVDAAHDAHPTHDAHPMHDPHAVHDPQTMHDAPAHGASVDPADAGAASASAGACDPAAGGRAPAHDHQPGADRCTVCAAYCSSTPLAMTWPAVAVPASLPAAAFPAWSAPAPTFLAGGTERPPRPC